MTWFRAVRHLLGFKLKGRSPFKRVKLELASVLRSSSPVCRLVFSLLCAARLVPRYAEHHEALDASGDSDELEALMARMESGVLGGGLGTAEWHEIGQRRVELAGLSMATPTELTTDESTLGWKRVRLRGR